MPQGVGEVVLACYLNHYRFLYGWGLPFAQQKDEVQVSVLTPQHWQLQRPLMGAAELPVFPWQQDVAEMT